MSCYRQTGMLPKINTPIQTDQNYDNGLDQLSYSVQLLYNRVVWSLLSQGVVLVLRMYGNTWLACQQTISQDVCTGLPENQG